MVTPQHHITKAASQASGNGREHFKPHKWLQGHTDSANAATEP